MRLVVIACYASNTVRQGKTYMHKNEFTMALRDDQHIFAQLINARVNKT